MLKGFKEFASYNKKERRGVYALLLLIAILTAGLYFDEYFYEVPAANRQEYESLLAYRAKAKERKDSMIAANLRAFDPNATSIEYLTRIGLPLPAAKSLVNFTKKGGRFRQPEDVLKIYRMDTAWFESVKAFVTIEGNNERFESRYDSEPQYAFEKFDPNAVSQQKLVDMGLRNWQARNLISYREKYKPFTQQSQLSEVYGLDSSLAKKLQEFAVIDSATFGRKAKPEEKLVTVDLNRADSVQLLKVSGIGPYTAGKILRLRAALGGFHSHEQLLEIYPIDSARLEKLRPQLLCNSEVKRIDLNLASYEELMAHPYLEYRVVKNIIHFRENIRPFNEVNELRNIELVDAPLFRKIAPYLMVEGKVPQE